MARKRKRWPKCPRCGGNVLRGGGSRGGLCSQCWRITNQENDKLDQDAARELEPERLSPIAAEKLIESWGRA